LTTFTNSQSVGMCN